MNNLETELKTLIIKCLNLEDMTPEDIVNSEPLFGEGLGLDSIDALEMGLTLQQTFGVNFKSESEDTKKYFYSIETLAKFIEENRTQ